MNTIKHISISIMDTQKDKREINKQKEHLKKCSTPYEERKSIGKSNYIGKYKKTI